MATKCTELTKDWGNTPHTHDSATPVEWRDVVDVSAVRITNGHLRGSNFDGIFELANGPLPIDIFHGKIRIEVKVGWFGCRPKKTWAHITPTTDWEILKNYSGSVVHNIAKRKTKS
jgi:hypothetical protein